MCLIVFAFRPGHALPLIVAANRDEYYKRSTAALAQWPHAQHIFAGRDLEAGGTWLGVTPNGRFAALTNIRGQLASPHQHSRGALVAHFLSGQQSPAAWLTHVAQQRHHYAGFNLLAGDSDALYFLNAQEGQPRALAAGIYGLSNATLNTPWPKLLQCRNALGEMLAQGNDVPDSQALFALLAQRTNSSASLEQRLLAAPFIADTDYGTRACTVLLRRADGTQWLAERRFGPQGRYLGEQCFTLAPTTLPAHAPIHSHVL